MQLGRTLREVSDTSGVSLTYLSDLERGVLTNPTLDTLRRLAEALGVSLNEILGVAQPARVEAATAPGLMDFLASQHFRDSLASQANVLGVSASILEVQ